MLRSDSAAYQKDVIRYCTEKENKRFGVIEFAISAKVTADFKADVFKFQRKTGNLFTRKMQMASPSRQSKSGQKFRSFLVG